MRALASLSIAFALSAGSVASAERRLTVEDAVQLALGSNPRVRAVGERVQAARAQADSVRGRLLFSVHLNDEWQHFDSPFAISFGPTSFPVRDQDTNTFSATASQPLLGLLHIGNDWSAAKKGADAALAGQRSSEAAVREAVRSGFLRYFGARALADIAAASVRELASQVQVAEARLKAGVITNADLLRVQVAQANAQQQQIAAATQADVARAQLLDLVGLDPRDTTVTLLEPTALLEQAASPLPESAAAGLEAARRRPDVLQAQLTLSSTEGQRRARLFSLLPEIDLEGGYLRIDGQQFAPKNQAYVGVRASWAVWEWGASFSQWRAAGRQASAAALELDAQKRQVVTEVEVGLKQNTAASVAVDVAQKAIASAEEAYRVTNALVQAGTATTTDLLDAQSALTTARLNLTRAQYERALARVSLSRTLGD